MSNSNANTKRFTFDPEQDGVEMPTLTALVYGKKPTTTVESNEGVFSLEPTKALDRNALLAELGKMPPPVPPSFLEENKKSPLNARGAHLNPHLITPAERSESICELVSHFKVEEAGTLSSKYKNTISYLFQAKKIQKALLFQPTKLSEGAFMAVSFIGAPSTTLSLSESLIQGSRFHPTAFSDLWGRLSKFGYSEFPPVGLSSQAHSFDRSSVRIAFGVDNTEWITLIYQQKQAAKELLLVVSPVSIAGVLPAALDKIA